jgi:hypothetical protein
MMDTPLQTPEQTQTPAGSRTGQTEDGSTTRGNRKHNRQLNNIELVRQ